MNDGNKNEALPACAQPRTHMTFRSSRIIYYGPHACSNCGALICKMGFEFGGNAFTYPDGPIYPNTEWHPHVCDPQRVAKLPTEALPIDTATGPFKYATGTLPTPPPIPPGCQHEWITDVTAPFCSKCGAHMPIPAPNFFWDLLRSAHLSPQGS
jgi:hypothetical protein